MSSGMQAELDWARVEGVPAGAAGTNRSAGAERLPAASTALMSDEEILGLTDLSGSGLDAGEENAAAAVGAAAGEITDRRVRVDGKSAQPEVRATQDRAIGDLAMRLADVGHAGCRRSARGGRSRPSASQGSAG